MPHPLDHALVLAGSTGSGKTALAVALAERIGAEVIGADSQQLYADLPQTTCQPTAEERRRVPHHLVGTLPATERMTAADYGERARDAGAAIAARGKRVMLVGGTGLYLRAALDGLFAGPKADLALRATLEQEATRDGALALHARLARIDPEAAARLPAADVLRVVRALEIHTLTGIPQSEHHRRHAASIKETRAQGVRWLALDVPREELYARLASRTARLFPALLAEAKALRDRGLENSPAARALGIAEGLQCLRGSLRAAEAQALTLQATRRYAKRQLTWFRAVPEVRWLSASEADVAALSALIASEPQWPPKAVTNAPAAKEIAP